MSKEETIDLLIKFLFYMRDKELINDHDFEYEKVAKQFLKWRDKRLGESVNIAKKE